MLFSGVASLQLRARASWRVMRCDGNNCVVGARCGAAVLKQCAPDVSGPRCPHRLRQHEHTNWHATAAALPKTRRDATSLLADCFNLSYVICARAVAVCCGRAVVALLTPHTAHETAAAVVDATKHSIVSRVGAVCIAFVQQHAVRRFLIYRAFWHAAAVAIDVMSRNLGGGSCSALGCSLR